MLTVLMVDHSTDYMHSCSISWSWSEIWKFIVTLLEIFGICKSRTTRSPGSPKMRTKKGQGIVNRTWNVIKNSLTWVFAPTCIRLSGQPPTRGRYYFSGQDRRFLSPNFCDGLVPATCFAPYRELMLFCALQLTLLQNKDHWLSRDAKNPSPTALAAYSGVSCGQIPQRV